jgi:hypothetical protein
LVGDHIKEAVPHPLADVHTLVRASPFGLEALAQDHEDLIEQYLGIRIATIRASANSTRNTGSTGKIEQDQAFCLDQCSVGLNRPFGQSLHAVIT